MLNIGANKLFRFFGTSGLATLFLSLATASCNRSLIYFDGSEYHLGLPAHERRDYPVDEMDLAIVDQAIILLEQEENWSPSNSQNCGQSSSRSLFCALHDAQIQQTGLYDHRRPAMQHVRFVIGDNFSNRWNEHRLTEFNSSPQTSYQDVLNILELARGQIFNLL